MRVGLTDVDRYINTESFRALFAADVPPAKTRLMAVTQRPLALPAFLEPSEAAAWKTVPSWSLVATQDNAIGTANTRFMAQRTVANAKGHVTEISASHAVLVSHPDAVEDLILRAVHGTNPPFNAPPRRAPWCWGDVRARHHHWATQS